MHFKGLFLADLHCSKVRTDGCLKVLNDVINYVETEPMPVFIAGDFWDSAITATDNSNYTQFTNALFDLSKITPVYMIYGTAGHEPNGSLEVFKFMGINVYDRNSFNTIEESNQKYELITLPEPRKSNYVSKGKDVNAIINREFEEFINSVPERSELPRIVIGHGEIRGVSYSNAMLANSPIAFPPSKLKKLNADFYGFGHIHQKQEVFKNCWYLGSPYQKSFSETHDPSMMIIEIFNEE